MKQNTLRHSMELNQNGVTMTIEPITSRSREGSIPKGAFVPDFETAFIITSDVNGNKTINQVDSAVNLAKVFGGVEYMAKYLSATIARAMFSLQNPAKTKRGQTIYSDGEKLAKLVEYFETIHETNNLASDTDAEFSALNKRMATAIKAGDFATVGNIAMEMKLLSDARAKLASVIE